LFSYNQSNEEDRQAEIPGIKLMSQHVPASTNNKEKGENVVA